MNGEVEITAFWFKFDDDGADTVPSQEMGENITLHSKKKTLNKHFEDPSVQYQQNLLQCHFNEYVVMAFLKQHMQQQQNDRAWLCTSMLRSRYATY